MSQDKPREWIMQRGSFSYYVIAEGEEPKKEWVNKPFAVIEKSAYDELQSKLEKLEAEKGQNDADHLLLMMKFSYVEKELAHEREKSKELVEILRKLNNECCASCGPIDEAEEARDKVQQLINEVEK